MLLSAKHDLNAPPVSSVFTLRHGVDLVQTFCAAKSSCLLLYPDRVS